MGKENPVHKKETISKCAGKNFQDTRKRGKRGMGPNDLTASPAAFILETASSGFS